MDLERLIWSVVTPGPLWDWLVSPALDINISSEMLRNSFAVRGTSELSLAQSILNERQTIGPWDSNFGWDSEAEAAATARLANSKGTNFLYLPEFFSASYVLGVCYKDSMNSWVQMLSEFESDPDLMLQIDEVSMRLSRFCLNLSDGNEFFSLCHLPGGYKGLILVRYDLDGEIEMNKVLLDRAPHPLKPPTKVLKVIRAISACKACLRAGMEICHCPEKERAKSFSPSDVAVPSYTEFVRRARHMKPRRQRMQMLDPIKDYAAGDLGLVQTHDYYFGDCSHLRTIRDHYTAFVAAFRVDPLMDYCWLAELGLPSGLVPHCQVEELPNDARELRDVNLLNDSSNLDQSWFESSEDLQQPLHPLVLAVEQSERPGVRDTASQGVASPPTVEDIVKREVNASTAVEVAPAIPEKVLVKRSRVQCDECGATFSKANNLTRHRATIHKGERSFRCEQCGQTFNQRIHLQRHVTAKHTNERKHECNQCSKTFAIHNNLARHVKAVHERARPFSCQGCNSRFFDRADLRKHVRRKHGRDIAGSTAGV